MSDSAEKPFDATPRRIAKAKREGNVARSGEFAANCSFAAAAVGVVASAGLFGSVAASALLRSLSLRASLSCALIVLVALLPVVCASVAGIVANLAQNGGLALSQIVPKLERLNPAEGLRRILSRETVNHSLRAALAFFCAVLAMTPSLVAGASALIRSSSLERSAAQTWSAAQHVAIAAGATGLIFSIGEYAAARGSWLRKLRMTFEERKREMKEEEGDAVARGRRRALHRSLLRGGFAKLKEASLVVVNPRHVAVALAYRPPRIAVPHVLLRVVDDAALQVRAAAASHRIPIVENVALARALYRDGRSGEPIPYAHYVAVAEVVAALMRADELRDLTK
jgi:flagellar biosynthesis protein FlhB